IIKKSTSITLSVGKYFDSCINPPKSFPSRFIDNNIDAKGQHFELLTFGSGRKICSGLNGDDFCGVLSGESILPERMAVEDVDMEEAPGLTVRKKSELLFVHVTTAPAAHLAFTNLAYCSPSDLSQFAVPR
ncbi:hypothetical protein HID58_075627, partial [Brassica napus]